MAAEVSLNVRLETPENVRLAYQLAGPALRSAAYAIDCLFRVLLITALLIGACLIAAILPGFTIGGILLALFFIEWLYYIVQEGFWNGYSMGKWLVGIRVIHTSGAPLTFWGLSCGIFCVWPTCCLLPWSLRMWPGSGFSLSMAPGFWRCR